MRRRDFIAVTSATALAAALPPPIRALSSRPLPPGTAARSLPAPWQWQAPGQQPAPPPAPRRDRYLWTVRRGYPVRL